MSLALNFKVMFSPLRIVYFSLLLVLASCHHKKVTLDSGVKKEDHATALNPVQEKMGLTKKEIKNSKLYSFVNDWYGVPYKYGGCQKTGVDCSCFTDLLYEHVYGMKTARTAGEIYKECDKVSLDKIREGDLVFFITSGKSVSHVGVYLKNDKFAHASTSKGVMISDLKETYYKKTFYSAGRLKHSLSWKD